MSIITSYDLQQKNLDLQILCSKKDIEIYKLKKQINSLINDVVITTDASLTTDNDDDNTNGLGVAIGEIITPLIKLEVKEEEPCFSKASVVKTINVKVKECYDCRREDRASFSTIGYKCKDENCMYFKRT
jgi:hypothetical protein